MIRYILGALVALLSLVSVPVTVNADTGPSSVYASATPQEDEADFNPCLHGTDGRYAHWDGDVLVIDDARYFTPGPCDLGTELPHGATFGVSVRPASSFTCPAGWVPVEVFVHVLGSDGVHRGASSQVECVTVANPTGDADTLARLFRLAARYA